jgi:hypothetical protein
MMLLDVRYGSLDCASLCSGRGLQCPAKILEAVQPLFDHVEARRVTEANGAIVPERGAWYDRYIGFAEQPVGEILGR